MNRGKLSSNPRVKRANLPCNGKKRKTIEEIVFRFAFGSPEGIRTLDLRRERAMSWTARRRGHVEVRHHSEYKGSIANALMIVNSPRCLMLLLSKTVPVNYSAIMSRLVDYTNGANHIEQKTTTTR